MSLEAALAENTAQIAAFTSLMQDKVLPVYERLIAGQAAALDKIEAPKATRTTRAKKDDAPAPEPVTAEPAATASGEGDAVSASETAVSMVDDVKPVGLSHLEKLKKAGDTEAANAFGAFMLSINSHFGGSAKLFERTDPDEAKQTLFFIKRKIAGLPVDFSADYDFDGDPEQGGASASDDDFG